MKAVLLVMAYVVNVLAQHLYCLTKLSSHMSFIGRSGTYLQVSGKVSSMSAPCFEATEALMESTKTQHQGVITWAVKVHFFLIVWEQKPEDKCQLTSANNLSMEKLLIPRHSVYCEDQERAASIGFEVTNKFQQVGEFANMEYE